MSGTGKPVLAMHGAAPKAIQELAGHSTLNFGQSVGNAEGRVVK